MTNSINTVMNRNDIKQLNENYMMGGASLAQQIYTDYKDQLTVQIAQELLALVEGGSAMSSNAPIDTSQPEGWDDAPGRQVRDGEW